MKDWIIFKIYVLYIGILLCLPNVEIEVQLENSDPVEIIQTHIY